MSSYFAVVTFGSPSRSVQLGHYYRTLARAYRAADAAMGTGSCTAARVYECDTRDLARTADISKIRKGESHVYSA